MLKRNFDSPGSGETLMNGDESVMLLNGYSKKIFRPECNPSFESVHCIATLDEDIFEALPYLNAELGGTQYYKDPPTVMFHAYGKIIKVSSREIAINAL